MFKLSFIGNVCTAVEQKQTNTGKTVTHFNVAVNVAQDKSEFIHVSAFGKLGENCMKYLDKGRKVYVRGSLSVSQYAFQGQNKVQLNVSADEVEFLSPRETKSENATVSQGKIEDEWTPMNNADLPF